MALKAGTYPLTAEMLIAAGPPLPPLPPLPSAPHALPLPHATPPHPGKDFPFDAGDNRTCSSVPLSAVARYFLLAANVHGPINAPLKMGFCLPSSCQSEELALYVTKLSQLLPGPLSNVSLTDVTVTSAPTVVQPWDTGASFSVLVLSLLIVCCIIGTLVESVRFRADIIAPLSATSVEPLIAEPATPAPDLESVTMAPRDGEPANSNTSLDGKADSEKADSATSVLRLDTRFMSERVISSLARFTSHFALPHNASRMVSTPEPQPTDCLNGIRVLSMLWIVVGHTFLMPEAITGYSNPLALSAAGWGDGRSWVFQLILGAEVRWASDS